MFEELKTEFNFFFKWFSSKIKNIMKIITKAKLPANEDRLFKIFEKIVNMSNEPKKSFSSMNKLKGFFDKYNNIFSKFSWFTFDLCRTAFIFNYRIIHKK